MQRRTFLNATAGLVLSAGCLAMPGVSLAAVLQPDLGFDLTQGSRTLKLYRPETRERLNIEYMRNGRWQENAYEAICWLMRDIRLGRAAAMDHNLIAVMDWTQRYLAQFGYTQAMQVLSGYRSPKTNAALEGAALHSEHINGKAVDMHIPGVSPEYLGRLFRWLSQGGVGTYSARGFVHMDTGAVRRWGQ